jgi:DNA-binding NtrC family response regulator
LVPQIPSAIRSTRAGWRRWFRSEREQIIAALTKDGGNRTAAAQALGISRRTLHYRLSEYRRQGYELE